MKKKVHLKHLVNEWLKKNHPHLYVSGDGSIGLIKEKGMKSQIFGTVYYGSVWDDYVEIIHNDRLVKYGLVITKIKAADPKFFEKLTKHLKD